MTENPEVVTRKESVLVNRETLTLERLALTAVMALLSWNVYTTNQLNVAQAVSAAKLEAIKTQIESQSANYATRAELAVLDAKFTQVEQRFVSWFDRLSSRINELETKHDKDNG